MNDYEPKVADLTVSELQALIRETVQQAVAEVIIEMNLIADAEAQIQMEAEVNAYLRDSIRGVDAHKASQRWQPDD